MKTLVTGGGGFLGAAIVRQLLDRGDEVTILARGRYPAVEALGAAAVQADLTEPDGLEEHVRGMDVVFHVASKTGMWGDAAEFERINVDGTRNLLAACRTAGVSRFVYTSSPSATFDGSDAVDATEADCPYPKHFHAPYPRTKALAEQLVLAANGDGLATTCLRPHLIYGPGDPHIVPRLIDRHRQGRLVQVGKGDNRVGITYVDNAAVAHLQAADALTGPFSPNAGKAYFITDGGSVVLWDWIRTLLERIGMPPLKRTVSVSLATRLTTALVWVWRLLGIRSEPPMTPWVVAELASTHFYDLAAAREDFGYTPLVSPEDAFEQTVAAFEMQAA